MTWGEELRALRLRAGVTQEELGMALLEYLGEPESPSRAQGLVSRLERGVRLRSAERAHRVAQCLATALAAPMAPPPVDEQTGTRRGAPRGGDRQRAPVPCPHCGGTGRA